MPLLDLAKITLHKTVTGVTCPVCGGYLELTVGSAGYWARLIQGSATTPQRYRCQDCRRRFKLSRSL